MNGYWTKEKCEYPMLGEGPLLCQREPHKGRGHVYVSSSVEKSELVEDF